MKVMLVLNLTSRFQVIILCSQPEYFYKHKEEGMRNDSVQKVVGGMQGLFAIRGVKWTCSTDWLWPQLLAFLRQGSHLGLPMFFYLCPDQVSQSAEPTLIVRRYLGRVNTKPELGSEQHQMLDYSHM